MAETSRKGVGNRKIGFLGEKIAVKFLQKKGYSIIETNYRKPWGELDIITARSGVIHVIEVKTMEVEDFSRERGHEPENLVDTRKLKKVAKTAALYMEDAKDNREYQIDVVAVLLNQETHTARCKHIEQVLEDSL